MTDARPERRKGQAVCQKFRRAYEQPMPTHESVYPGDTAAVDVEAIRKALYRLRHGDQNKKSSYAVDLFRVESFVLEALSTLPPSPAEVERLTRERDGLLEQKAEAAAIQRAWQEITEAFEHQCDLREQAEAERDALREILRSCAIQRGQDGDGTVERLCVICGAVDSDIDPDLEHEIGCPLKAKPPETLKPVNMGDYALLAQRLKTARDDAEVRELLWDYRLILEGALFVADRAVKSQDRPEPKAETLKADVALSTTDAPAGPTAR